MSISSWKTIEAGTLARNRPLRRLLLAQFSATAALYGLGLAGVALVEERTHSSAQTGIAILASILPAFLGSLVSGAVVDRWGRVRVLLASHLARALVAIAFWLGVQWLPLGWVLALVYGASAMMALFAQFAMPAELALLPDLAAQEQLVAANTLYQFGMLVAEGVGIVALGPVVIKLAGVPAMGLLSGLLCLLSLALVVTLPRTAADAAKAWSGWTALGGDLRAGWRVIARDRLLRLVVVQATLAAALLLVLLSFVPGLAARHLGLGVEDAPLLILPGGIGFALGSLLVNRWEKRMSRQTWVAWGLVIAGLGIGLLAASIGGGHWSCLLLSLAPIVGLGLALAMVIIPARTLLEERPPPQMRGRVIASQLALGNAAAVIPLLLGGTVADAVGIRPVMGFVSLLALGGGAIGLHYARVYGPEQQL